MDRHAELDGRIRELFGLNYSRIEIARRLDVARVKVSRRLVRMGLS